MSFAINHSSVAANSGTFCLPAGSGSEEIPASTQSAPTKGVRDAKFEHRSDYLGYLIDGRRQEKAYGQDRPEPRQVRSGRKIAGVAAPRVGSSTEAPAESAADEISVTISHPQASSPWLAVTAGEDAAPPVSSPAPSSTAGERSVRFAIWPSPLPCRAAGGEGIRDGLINRIPTRETRLPSHSEAA